MSGPRNMHVSSETLVHINLPAVTKKWKVASLIFNGLKRIVRS